MLWPGHPRLTRDITRFAALEGRCFVISAAGLLRREDVDRSFPLYEALFADPGRRELAYLPSGGSAIAGPDGRWLVEPRPADGPGGEGLIIAELDLDAVARERHNLDVAGHYHRPDVFEFTVDRSRRPPVRFLDGPDERASLWPAPPPAGAILPPAPTPPPPPPRHSGEAGETGETGETGEKG